MKQKSKLKASIKLLFIIILIFFFRDSGSGNGWEMFSKRSDELQQGNNKKALENISSESWMGIYIEGIKVGYTHIWKTNFYKENTLYKRAINESQMRVSRLGGNPVEITTIQESLYDDAGQPVETSVRTRMAKGETVIQAEIESDKILFRSNDRLIKELLYEEVFYLDIPLEEIVNEKGLQAGEKYVFKILDPLTYSIIDSRLKVLGKEEILILGKKLNLWHIKSEMISVIPVVIDEWIDDSGVCWKSISQASFVTTTSIRMSKEKALEISEKNFDIAFSSIIESNVILDNPREIQKLTFKLSGIPVNKIKEFPFDDESQKILEVHDDYVIIQTKSLVLEEGEAIPFPVEDMEFSDYLKATFFCQSDDPELIDTARKIVGRERNSWRASKVIAQWIKKEMTPNYDVGFASALETLKSKEGDCSEHTVLSVALCRAVGIPARAAVGIIYANGIFAYHMWPEVYVGQWVGLDAKWLAVDEKSGEYFTDATHVKFGQSDLDVNIFKEMAQAVAEIIGQLKLEIINYYQYE